VSRLCVMLLIAASAVIAKADCRVDPIPASWGFSNPPGRIEENRVRLNEAGQITTTFYLRLRQPLPLDAVAMVIEFTDAQGQEPKPTRSSAKFGDLENQFSADMASLDHPMRSGSVFRWKHVNRRYADQSSINQIRNLSHRVPSSLKVDNESDLAEASTLRFLPIALDVTVCGHCEDAYQPAVGPEHVQSLRLGGGPYDVKDDINALCRPVTNRSAYVFGLVVNYTVCA
jgi:hypothetical protein